MMIWSKRKIWNLVISSVVVFLLVNVQTVLANSVTLSGILQYDEQPMSDITDVSPTFWCRNLETGQEDIGITSIYDNNTGVYSISGLPPAKVQIFVTFHIRGVKPTLPGNYRIWKIADIPNLSLDQRANFDIGLEQVIHMTSPWDNDAIGRLTYAPYPEHSRCLDFTWDAVPGATQYQITISIYRDPNHPDGYGRVESVLNSYVQDTSFSTNLDLSNDFQHYQASIFAYGSGGNRIGLFMITYENGYGWDYRFKVVARWDVDGDCLSDNAELIYGTDPNNPDTDGDGLLDGREVGMAQGGGCPNPLDPDSDDDTLSDGDEVLNLGTNPCNSDTDGDGVRDDEDHLPNYPHVGTTIYVDDDATGANDGSSWADAYWCLQDALAAGQYADEIRVAQGTYKPDQRVTMVRLVPQVRSSGDRTETFQLISGVSLKGGYAGFGEPDPDARDTKLYETILSGDLNSDDMPVANSSELPDEPTRAENSIHVVTGSRCDETAVLNGFTITDGNANGPTAADKCGGGMYNQNGSPTLIRCIFHSNNSTQSLEFIGTLDGGGAIYNSGGRPALTQCTFTNNNSVRDGGGIFNINSRPTFTDGTSNGNSAGISGGGMYNIESNPAVTNCIFAGNSAQHGGGMRNWNSNPTLTNCVFTGNWVETRRRPDQIISGGAISNNNRSDPMLTNCILWGNTPEEIYGGTPVITYSDIQGGWPGEGNIDADPMFVDAANGDYHLQVGSPCIDGGDNSAIPAGVIVDLDGNPRIINGIVDMGAYEGGMAPPPPTLAEALDTALSFTTGGNADWFSQTTTSYYDGDAAQSGDISHSQDSWMETTVSGTGTVKFHWKVSSEEDYDFLQFRIDGSMKDRISGSANWEQRTYTISTPGSHTLEWRYVKDGSGDSGSDCGWVDKVEWVTN